MDTNFSVVFKGSIVDHMEIVDVEKNLQKQLKLSEEKSKQFLAKNRIIKKGLSEKQALKLQSNLLKIGMETQLLSNQKNEVYSVEKSVEPQVKITQNDIDSLLNGKMTKIKPSLSYNVGLFLTLILTLSIPLIYLSITLLSIGSTAWFILNVSTLFDFQQAKLIKLLVAFSLIFMGVLLSFFLLRPLVPHRYQNTDERLKEEEHPDLFHLIQVLSTYMSVPMPSEIRVNNEVNASASLKDGFISIFNNKLVLTLGYPLISGMDTRQLVGVIAHEFGHFSQRYGMAVYYLINVTNYWLQERAYARYGLALKLKVWREKYEDGYILAPVWTASAGIWISQQFLKYLSQFSLYFSQHMSREMEFNADHHECRITGSDNFLNTSMRLHELSYAQSKITEINDVFWDENSLLNNIPEAINYLANHLTTHEKSQIQESIDFQESHPWDSHPADNQRINHAVGLKETGVFVLEKKSNDLLGNYDELCKTRTLDIYRGGRKISFEEFVVENDILFAMQQEDETSLRLSRIALFGLDLGNRMANIPVKLPEVLKGISVKEIHEHYLKNSDDIAKRMSRYADIYYKCVQHNKAYAYVQAGFEIDNETFNINDNDRNSVEAVLRKTEKAFSEAEKGLNILDQLITARIISSLTDKPKAILVNAYDEIKTLKAIKGLEGKIHGIRFLCAAIGMLADDDEPTESIRHIISLQKSVLATEIKELSESISLIPAVNRFSNQSMTLLDFSKTWRKVPEYSLEELSPIKLCSYSESMCNSIMRQHVFHFNRLLMIINSNESSH